MADLVVYRCNRCWAHVEAPNTGAERDINCPFCNRTTRGTRRLGEDVTDAEKMLFEHSWFGLVLAALTASSPWALFGGWF